MSKIDMKRLSVLIRHLELAIADEVGKRVPDAIRLRRLKKLRLSIKDQLFGHIGRGELAGA